VHRRIRGNTRPTRKNGRHMATRPQQQKNNAIHQYIHLQPPKGVEEQQLKLGLRCEPVLIVDSLSGEQYTKRSNSLWMGCRDNVFALYTKLGNGFGTPTTSECWASLVVEHPTLILRVTSESSANRAVQPKV